MRKFLQLAMILLVAVIAAGSPLATVGVPHAAPAVAAAPHAAPAIAVTGQAAATPQFAATSSIESNPALICILPRCNGPYCRASNGCWVCCTN